MHSLCDPSASIILIGNKCDLEDKRVISLAEAENFAKNHQLMYLETSALNGKNVTEAFMKTATEIYRKGVKALPKPKKKKKKKSDDSSCCG